MKTAGRENPNHGATLPHNRAHGAVGQNRFRLIRGAAKQEKFQPKEGCFFLTSPFIELLRTWPELASLYGSAVDVRVTIPHRRSEMADDRCVIMTVACPRCKAKQRIHIAEPIRAAQNVDQAVACLVCNTRFKLTLPNRIVGVRSG